MPHLQSKVAASLGDSEEQFAGSHVVCCEVPEVRPTSGTHGLSVTPQPHTTEEIDQIVSAEIPPEHGEKRINPQ